MLGVGVGGFAEPAAALDFGNSGTGCRLTMGAVAGCPITATFDGDACLRTRPMRRILDPLELMGARTLEIRDGGRLPLSLRGATDPMPIEYEAPVPSAQLKSAVLLAGLAAPGVTTVIEKEATRDHTEKMLKHFGARSRVSSVGNHGRRITLEGQPELEAAPVMVPADPSSAAFPLVAALIVPGSDVILEGVMANPLRTGLYTTLREMGAVIEIVQQRNEGGEEVVDLRVKGGALKGVDVPAERAPSMIDEYPVLAVASAFAEGVDAHARIAGASRQGIRPAGSHRRHAAQQRRRGRDRGRRPDRARQGTRAAAAARSSTHMDHRIAMSALVMGLASEQPVQVDDAAFIATSFPGFVRPDALAGRRARMIIAIDGPAASGKGTLGKRLAAHYGLRHLDTGLLYRAVAKAVLDAGHSPHDAGGGGRRRTRSILRVSMRLRLKSHGSAKPPRSSSAIPEVRAALLDLQRSFARRRPAPCSTAATSAP